MRRNKETIESVTRETAWIRWSGVLGLYKMQKQSIIKDIEKLLEEPEEITNSIGNEEIYFDNAGDFSGNGCFRAGNGARFHVIAGADSFKCNAGYNSRCGSTAPASGIAHRDGEDATAASERSAGCIGKGKPQW